MIPKNSLVHTYLLSNYSNVYSIEVKSTNKISADDVMVNFWLDFPFWVDALFKIRNFIVGFFGLEGGSNNKNKSKEFEQIIREGKQMGIVSIVAKNNNETVMLLKDKHLDAYISVYVNNSELIKKVYATTLVNFHNKLGRVYFFVIKPFHGLLVKSMLKRAVLKALK